MPAPLYDVCVIARNEVKTLPKLRESLNAFFDAGGQANLLDTGSTDGTVDLARQLGFTVKEVGEKYLVEVTNYTAINYKFCAEGEKAIVKKGDKYFNFAAARNECAAMAKQKIVFWHDADEASVTMDIEKINSLIEEGYTQFEYFFTFAFDAFGNEAVKFVQCKAYDRTVMRWDGRVHELVIGIERNVGGKRIFLDEATYKLAHYQNHDTGRHSYLIGLAVDCFEFPKNDRHLHYCARELFWNGRPKSALKMFKEHIKLGGWASERAESHLFMGKIYGTLNNPAEQVRQFNEAFYIDSGRNSALIELAAFYRHNKNWQAAICYAKAALEIPYNGFYADNLSNYREIPHDILYTCYGYMGRIDEAKSHLLKALEYQPYNPQFLRDTKFYFEYGCPDVEGWMRFPEIQFLYSEAKKHNVIVEVGSWKGRSTNAICSGNKNAKIFAVDTWAGSKDERDLTNSLAKQEDIFQTFCNNTKQFLNLTPIIKTSVEAARVFEDGSIDWVFIDAGHTYDEVKEDVLAWLPKVKMGGVISGHDYEPSVWMEVCKAVDEIFSGIKVNVVDSIWWVKNYSPFGKHYAPIRFNKSREMASNPVAMEQFKEFITPTIPKKVYTAWFGEPMPELVSKCIESQRKMCEEFGYEHILITLENLSSQVGYLPYLQDAINSPHPAGVKYCKATDYLRMKILYWFGGIFVDSDFEVLPGKNFDAMLGDQMFVGLEVADWANGKVVLGTAVVGSIPNHPMVKEWMETVEIDFRGDDNLNYESSMNLLNLIGVKYQDRMKLWEPEYFYPFEWLHSGQTKITENTIGIHHFMRTWIPETNKKSTLQQFKYNIENNINFTFVKRGDGELACMNGESGGNCDGHPYSKELGDKLREAYEYFAVRKNTTIVEFDDQVNYNVLLHRTDSNLKEVSDFYKAISTSNRPKYFVGPERLKPVSEYLRAKHIVIPEVNWWSKYDEIMKHMPLEPAAIYLFCAGMPAKVLMHHIMKYEYNSPPGTYLDCGSAFDPSVGITRTFQISKNEFWFLYDPKTEEVFHLEYPKEEPVNNFLLPQETHPERLWAIDQIKRQ